MANFYSKFRLFIVLILNRNDQDFFFFCIVLFCSSKKVVKMRDRCMGQGAGVKMPYKVEKSK